MSFTNYVECCGITELANIADDDNPTQSLMNIDPTAQGIVFFSDINTNKKYSAGKALAEEIKKHNLGMLVELPPTINPNTKHKVKMWSWKLNRKKLQSFQKQERKNNPDLYRNPYDDYYDGVGGYYVGNFNRW